MSAGSRGFIGQEKAWDEWIAAIGSQRMHHAWLLAGARGLGKTAFARAAAAELEEIVVTATKRESGLQEIPMSISAISGDSLERS